VERHEEIAEPVDPGVDVSELFRDADDATFTLPTELATALRRAEAAHDGGIPSIGRNYIVQVGCGICPVPLCDHDITLYT
jgi:hypothetical protein